MAERGDVVQLIRRQGFGSDGAAEAVVVIQASRLNAALPTTVVVPLDPQVSSWGGQPLVVKVSAAESGSTVEHVAMPTHLRVVRQDRLAPGRVGKLDAGTLSRLDEVMRLVLDL